MSLPGKAQPGLIALLGSGETSPAGGQAFDALARRLPDPLNISILETPAGFELNSSQVAGRVADFLKVRLQNFHASANLIPARKRGTPYSPDNLELLAPLLDSQMIFFGPGSPTYAVRQLNGSLAWSMVQARHRSGAALALASAATVSVGSVALPVYEIFKVGEDPHWKPGLGLLAPWGLSLAIIPHWNNNEGGADVDTSHCFIGSARFEQLQAELDPGVTVLGIDEHSSLVIDLAGQACKVYGRDGVHILRGGKEARFCEGDDFPIAELGNFAPLKDPQEGIQPSVWQQVIEAEEKRAADQQSSQLAPPEIEALVAERQEAREQRNWYEADRLRQVLLDKGWAVKDTPSGPEISRR